MRNGIIPPKRVSQALPRDFRIEGFAGLDIFAVKEVKSAVRAWSSLEIGLAASIAVLLGCGSVAYFRLRRRKSPAEMERLRRLSLGRSGRITAGEITGLIDPEGEDPALQLVYRYDVAGVTYEVRQDISTLPAVAEAPALLIGKGISVKYEMKHPSNSIAVCEVWSGINGINVGETDGPGAFSVSSAMTKKP